MKRWEVYRCQFADEGGPNNACGIREIDEESSVCRMVVSDTARDECCHHMRLADAQRIVEMFNNQLVVIKVPGNVPSAQFDEFREKFARESARPLLVDSEVSQAIERVQEVGGTPDRLPIPPENVDKAREAGLDVEVLTEAEDIRNWRQATIGRWAKAAFGETEATSLPQRSFRVLEEAIEMAQACGVNLAKVVQLAEYVYGRPTGEVEQALGGLGVTLLALAQAAGLSAERCERNEVERVLAKPVSHFAARNALKNQAGMRVI